MSTVENGVKPLEVDEEGFLRIALKTWDADWAKRVMRKEGIEELTPECQRVLDEIWAHYKQTGLVPIIQVLAKKTGLTPVRISELSLVSPKNWATKMLGLRAIDCRMSHSD